jgi:hypothetical protein
MKKGTKVKLNLNDIKVQSFVTALENADQQTVQGGSVGNSANPVCRTEHGDQCRIVITPGAQCSAFFPC